MKQPNKNTLKIDIAKAEESSDKGVNWERRREINHSQYHHA